jgi:hypothetical protein
MNIGHLRATSDNETGKIGPVPQSFAEKDEALRRKPNHTSLSASTLEPPKPSSSASSGLVFARNAVRPNSVNRP